MVYFSSLSGVPSMCGHATGSLPLAASASSGAVGTQCLSWRRVSMATPPSPRSPGVVSRKGSDSSTFSPSHRSVHAQCFVFPRVQRKAAVQLFRGGP